MFFFDFVLSCIHKQSYCNWHRNNLKINSGMNCDLVDLMTAGLAAGSMPENVIFVNV
jgi:hypothetical protein